MIYLRQSTAGQEVPLGYFLDSGDGDTEETGLSIANTDIRIWKAGATTLANKNSGGASHIANGIYYAVLDATDTDTIGSLVVFVHVSGALTVRLECVVWAANVYDSLIGGGDSLEVDAVALSGSASAADRLEASALTMQVGTVDDSVLTPTSTQFECDDITEATADHYIGKMVVVTSGDLQYQTSYITDYALVGSNGRFTVQEFASGETLADGDTVLIV